MMKLFGGGGGKDVAIEASGEAKVMEAEGQGGEAVGDGNSRPPTTGSEGGGLVDGGALSQSVANDNSGSPVRDAIKDGDDEMDAVVKLKSGQKRSQQKKKKNQFSYSGAEKEALLEAVYQVEERFKERELIRIKVISIEVSDLPPVHKFMKNQPYLKCTVGQENNFTLPCIQSDDGSKGSWSNIEDWDFKLERNERDRKDMIVSVCTHDLIIGRYVLLAHEFSLIPQSKSGYFEVSGEVLNAIGHAGRIQMTCKRYVGDRPKRPAVNPKDLADTASVLGTHVVKPHQALSPDKLDKLGKQIELDEQSIAQEGIVNIVKNLDKINVKFGSIAVTDLPSVHLVELNSPYVVISRGKWKKNTEAVISGGPTGKWTKLRWKLVLNRHDVINLDIYSQNVFIGKCVISFDDILERFIVDKNQNKQILDFVRVLNNGTTTTGNLKIKLQLSTNENMEVLFETQNQLAKQIIQQQQAMQLQEQLVASAQALLRNRGDDDDEENGGGDDVAMSPGPAPGTPQLRDVTELASMSPSNSLFPPTSHLKYLNPNVKLEPKVIIKDCPFQITLVSISVFDLKQANILMPNSPYVTVACGSRGFTTDTLNNTANFGHWTHIDQSFVVMTPANKLRMIVWSRGEEIGQCVIESDKLISQPLDYEGYTEFYVKLMGVNTDAASVMAQADEGLGTSKRKFVTGRMKFICKYDLCDPDALFPSRKLVEANKKAAQIEKASNFGFHHKIPLSAVSYSEFLPCLATVMSISVYDLKQIHKTETPLDYLYYAKNVPQVKIICDRKSAITKVLGSEYHDNGRWERLLWQLVVTEGSFLLISVLSRGKMIGRIELNAKTLVTTPKINGNLTEFKANIADIDGRSTGKIHITFRLEKVPDHFDADPTRTGFQDELGFKNKYDPDISSPTKMKKKGQSDESKKKKTNFMTPTKAELMSQSKSQMIQRFGQGSNLSPSNTNLFTAAGGSPGESVTSEPDINIFDLKKNNMAVQIRIIDIDVFELKQIHMFKSNSPFVSVQCGKFIETSKEIIGGGEIGYWSQLNWIFKLKLDNSLRVTVGSSNKMIGLSAIFPEALILNKKDSTGLYRFVDLLYDGLKETGKVKLTYEMSIARDRKAVLETTSKQKTVLIPSGTVTNTGSLVPLSATGQDADEDDDFDIGKDIRPSSNAQDAGELPFDADDEFDLKFPLLVTFNSLVLSDVYLQSKSVIAAIENAFDFKKTKKYLRIKISTGKQSISTDAALLSLDMVQWDKFFQSLLLEHIHSEIIVSVFACSVRGGTSAERDSSDAVVLIDEERLVGGVVITAEELCDIPRNNVGITEFSKTVSNGKYCTGLISLSLKLEPKIIAPGELAEREMIDSALSNELEDSPEKAVKKGINVRDALLRKDKEIGAADKKMEAAIKANVTQLMENVNKRLVADPNAPSSSTEVSPRVPGVTATTGVTWKPITAAPISAKEIDNSAVIGAGQAASTARPSSARPTSARPTSARPSSAVVRGINNSTLLSSQDINSFIKFGYNIKIHKVSVIKLKAMHKLVKNSPLATFICGNVISTTPILTNAGSSGTWDKLENFHFVVHDNVDLSITLSSKSLVIGSCTFTLHQLLNETEFKQDLEKDKVPNKLRYINKESELLTIFGDLLNSDGELTGNIKISFKAKAMN